MRRNERKRQTLRIFAEHGALTPHEFAALAGIFPLRNTYTLLNRLHRWRLLSRRRSRATGRIVFNLTDLGRARLEFLCKSLGFR
jgi:DNA-binding IclR family transcriptional regulator